MCSCRWRGRVSRRLLLPGDRALERVSLAVDGGFFAVAPGSDRRPRLFRLRSRGGLGLGARCGGNITRRRATAPAVSYLPAAVRLKQEASMLKEKSCSGSVPTAIVAILYNRNSVGAAMSSIIWFRHR